MVFSEEAASTSLTCMLMRCEQAGAQWSSGTEKKSEVSERPFTRNAAPGAREIGGEMVGQAAIVTASEQELRVRERRRGK